MEDHKPVAPGMKDAPAGLPGMRACRAQDGRKECNCVLMG